MAFNRAAQRENNSVAARLVRKALQKGFTRAYKTIEVNPRKFYSQLGKSHHLAVSSSQSMFAVPLPVIDKLADEIIRSDMKKAAAEGAGFGMGGIITLLPDLSVLAAITVRSIQKLSLVYGFEFVTDEEVSEFWVAAATAAGIDISKDILEKQVVKRFVPRVIERIAARASAEVVEKWMARLVPMVSSVIGGGMNYYFVRAWGNRAKAHFRERHLLVRSQPGSHQTPEAGIQSLPR